MIWNPWKALVEARKEIDRLRNILVERDEELSASHRARVDEIREFKLRDRLLYDAINRLEVKIKSAHFRDPKTGRIGRKGVTF